MRALGFVGVLIALAVGYAVYGGQVSRPGATGGGTPQQTIDLTAVRRTLLEIAQAQRHYVNAHGRYGTLDELRADGPPSLGSDSRGYTFTVSTSGATGFRVMARPTGAAAPARPTLVIDETMEIRTAGP